LSTTPNYGVCSTLLEITPGVSGIAKAKAKASDMANKHRTYTCGVALATVKTATA
jgi:hypothetical protein